MLGLPLNTIIPIVFSILYIIFYFVMLNRSKKTGNGFSYRPTWLILSFGILIFCVYCLITGKDITQFLG